MVPLKTPSKVRICLVLKYALAALCQNMLPYEFPSKIVQGVEASSEQVHTLNSERVHMSFLLYAWSTCLHKPGQPVYPSLVNQFTQAW